MFELALGVDSLTDSDWGWSVVDADGRRVYPVRGIRPGSLNYLSKALLGQTRDTLNRSPLSYHMLILDGLSPIEAARRILEQTE